MPYLTGNSVFSARCAAPHELVMHNAPRLLALLRFPSFMNGTHPKYKKIIAVHPGTSITVKFDRPTDMQIDGEPIENVTEYTIKCL